MATHPSNPAWEIPWAEAPAGLQFRGSQSRTRVSDCAHSSVDKGHGARKNPAQRAAGRERDRP